MTGNDVQNWLDAYGAAWVNRDPDRVVMLFAETARYRETPFDEAMTGRAEIRSYWQDGAADTQENVEFSSQVWAVDGTRAFAGWQARFQRKISGRRVVLDGVFRLTFSTAGGVLICQSLEEWWHRKES